MDSRSDNDVYTKNIQSAPKPNFLIIGAQKAATTWMRDALDMHPDVFMAKGEPQFFNRDASTFESYLNLFREGAGRPVVGEKTPDYLHMSSLRIRRLQRSLGNVKLLVVLRKPQERAWSQARMEESAFNRSVLDSQTQNRLARNVISLRNRDRCRYAHHLRRWQKVFPRDAMMITFYEDIVSRPEAVLREIYRWLNVNPVHCREFPKPVWQSPDADRPDAIMSYLHRIHGRECKRLAALGISPPPCWNAEESTESDQDLSSGHAVFTQPLARQQIAMIVPNVAYRLYDTARGLIPGRYWSAANQAFHRYLISEHRRGRIRPSD